MLHVFNGYFQSRKVTPEDCLLIEKGTRGQYKNRKWHRARLYRITASVFGRICKKKIAARLKYTKSKQRILKSLQVSQCGLCVNSEYPTLGASPDGIVIVDGQREGILEIKCPYKWRNSTLHDAAQDSDFCCGLEKDGVKLKTTHVYYFQIQGQIAVTKTKWCDFVV